MANSKKFEAFSQTTSKILFFLLALVLFPIMQLFKKVLLPVFNFIRTVVSSLAWLMQIAIKGVARNIIRPLWRYVFKTPCVFLYNYLLKPVAVFAYKSLNIAVVQPIYMLFRGIAWLALSCAHGLLHLKNVIVRSGRYKNTIKPSVVTPSLKAYFLFSHYTMNLAARYTFFAIGYMVLSFIEAGRQLSNLLVGGYYAADRGLIGVYKFMRVDLQTHEWRKPLIQQQLLPKKQTPKNTKQPTSDGDQNKPLVVQNDVDELSSLGSKTKLDQVSVGNP